VVLEWVLITDDSFTLLCTRRMKEYPHGLPLCPSLLPSLLHVWMLSVLIRA
jgi:hypothetical protein